MTEKYFIFCRVHQAGGYSHNVDDNVCEYCQKHRLEALESKNSQKIGFDMDNIKQLILENNLEVPQ